MSTISSFKSRENKHDIYGGKDCMKKLFEPLSEHKMEIINFKKKKMKPLTNEQQKSYQIVTFVLFGKKNLKINMLKINNIVRIGTIFIIQENIEVRIVNLI